MSFDAQKQIRENTLELQEFLKDLKQWENRVKENDKQTKSQSQDFVSDIPPVRGHRPPVRGHRQERSLRDLSHTNKEEAKEVGSEAKQVNNKSKPETAAKHTYEYFGDKWDKFDVDAELRKVDDNDSPSSSIYKEDSSKEKGQKAAKQVIQTQVSGNAQIRHLPSSKSDLVIGNDVGAMHKKQTSDSFVEATNEKEMGNKLFKEKKFVQAIECYSRSIALQPSAVSYANRAMAYIKIRRFKEAEADCTEAIALDDRYIKAYSRRATVRKELGNILGSVADAEFALRLEPDNKELKYQYNNAKAMCEKMVSARSEEKFPVHIDEIQTCKNAELSGKGDNSDSTLMIEKESAKFLPMMSRHNPEHGKVAKESEAVFVAAQTLAASVAAGRLTTTKNISVPKNFYEFEATWKSFSSNSVQQAELLKVINPPALPQLFKDNLSPKLLGEILRSLQYFFPDNASHAIEVLESLAMAKRFNITAMCLSSKEKPEIGKLWEEVFAGPQVDEEKAKVLRQLRPKFQI